VEPGMADAMRLPLRDASVDLAFLVAVLGEVPDREAAVDELVRVLKPGGALAFNETLTDPDYVSPGELRRLCLDRGLEETSFSSRVLTFIIRFEKPRPK
jgi:ubiquinone/menaquinone biosynthesis C-methylase UbiE